MRSAFWHPRERSDEAGRRHRAGVRQTARCGSKRWNPTDSAASRSQTDGRRNQANDAREEIGVLRFGLRSREEVPICQERLVELLPILRAQHTCCEREDLLLLQGHVPEVEVHVPGRCLLEVDASRLPHDLEREKRVLEFADSPLTLAVV